MPKRKARKGAKKAKHHRKLGSSRDSVTRQSLAKRRPSKARKTAARKATARRAAAQRSAARTAAARSAREAAARRAVAQRSAARAAAARKRVKQRHTSQPTARVARKAPRLERARRVLEDVVPSPPSSLSLNRRGSAVRTGRAELAERRLQRAGMPPAITAGDVDVDLENAYFTGDESPGGDNPTPDQEVVDEIGRALGVEYRDNEELRASDKVVERDKHRWELDPASSEDYRNRRK